MCTAFLQCCHYFIVRTWESVWVPFYPVVRPATPSDYIEINKCVITNPKLILGDGSAIDPISSARALPQNPYKIPKLSPGVHVMLE